MTRVQRRVLGIRNRTENWKTARHLSQFFGDRAFLLAQELGEPQGTEPADVALELYWKGASATGGMERTRRTNRNVTGASSNAAASGTGASASRSKGPAFSAICSPGTTPFRRKPTGTS